MHVLAVLGHIVHVRNFIGSGCLDMLAGRGHELTLVVHGYAMAPVIEAGASWPRRPMVLPLEPVLPSRWRRTLRTWAHMASFVHRRRYMTYRHKLRMGVRHPRLRTRVKYIVQTGVARLMEPFVDLEAFWRSVEARIPLQRSAVDLIAFLQPDVLFTATSIHDGTDIELVKAAQARGVPVVAFAGSWDNLTSKGMFYVQPDHLLVWGEENRQQAMTHHGFRPEQITVTGAPPFDVYGTSRDA